MKTSQYQICTNCVMDTTDSAIVFDENGVCDHCHNFYNNIQPNWDTGESGQQKLQLIMDKIKKAGKGKQFDCIIGMSGGADSSFMLHVLVTQFGLKPLVFHVDGGWNSELAVRNIQVMIEKLGLDLYTEVINWEEMKDFQLAYIKSGMPCIDVPQDHAFGASLYNFAEKHNIKYIINGFNYSTECVKNPKEWIYFGTDMRQINDVIKKFGTIPLKTYPFSGILNHKFYLKYIRGIKVIRPLNYIPYQKEQAMQLLHDIYGWQPYPQKHFESRFTKFFEGYWLSQKFGFDTRKVQFSSMILTGQMTREEAIEKLKSPAIEEKEAEKDFEYVANKLGISVEELRYYFNQENKSYKDYDNQETLFLLGTKILKLFGIERSIKR